MSSLVGCGGGGDIAFVCAADNGDLVNSSSSLSASSLSESFGDIVSAAVLAGELEWLEAFQSS